MVMVFKPLTTLFLLYHGGKFYWWRKPEYAKKTIYQFHNIISSTPHLSGDSNSTSMVIGTNCI